MGVRPNVLRPYTVRKGVLVPTFLCALLRAPSLRCAIVQIGPEGAAGDYPVPPDFRALEPPVKDLAAEGAGTEAGFFGCFAKRETIGWEFDHGANLRSERCKRKSALAPLTYGR